MTMKPNCLPIRDDRRTKSLWRAPGKAASRSGKSSGQAMLELCLILPVLLLLILGTIELGRAAYFEIEVSDAARAGALYAAQSMADAVDGAGILQAVQKNAQDLSLTNANLNLPPLVCVCPGSASVTTGTCPGGGCTNPQVYVTVNTSYSLSPLFQYPGLPATFPLHGSSIMPVRQQ